MNDTEKQECQNVLRTSEGVTMEDYFTELNSMLLMNIDDLKSEFKNNYPDETNWSF